MIFRAISWIESVTNLPKDRCVNVWFYEGDVLNSTAADAIDNFMENFWTEDVSGTNVGRILSDQMQPLVTWASYNMGDAEPRVPIRISTAPLDIVATTTMERSVAAVLSHSATPVSGVNMARMRGRKYIGALHAGAGEETAGDFRPTAATRNLLLGALQGAVTAANAGELDFGVYSTGARDNSDPEIPYEERPLLPPIFTESTQAYVSNAFGNIRKRGLSQTLRTAGAI